MKYDTGDLEAVMQRDPAIIDKEDAMNYHTGFQAACMYRESHELWFVGKENEAHKLTGCDIHPGAAIGKRLFIDHATEIVAGETAIVGDDVAIYQGVTLGSVSTEKEKRYPTIGNRMVMGDDVRIGAESVVVKNVLPDCTIVGVPGCAVGCEGVRIDMKNAFDHNRLPNIIAKKIEELQKSVNRLEKEVSDLRKKNLRLKEGR